MKAAHSRTASREGGGRQRQHQADGQGRATTWACRRLRGRAPVAHPAGGWKTCSPTLGPPSRRRTVKGARHQVHARCSRWSDAPCASVTLPSCGVEASGPGRTAPCSSSSRPAHWRCGGQAPRQAPSSMLVVAAHRATQHTHSLTRRPAKVVGHLVVVERVLALSRRRPHAHVTSGAGGRHGRAVGSAPAPGHDRWGRTEPHPAAAALPGALRARNSSMQLNRKTASAPGREHIGLRDAPIGSAQDGRPITGPGGGHPAPARARHRPPRPARQDRAAARGPQRAGQPRWRRRQGPHAHRRRAAHSPPAAGGWSQGAPADGEAAKRAAAGLLRTSSSTRSSKCSPRLLLPSRWRWPATLAAPTPPSRTGPPCSPPTACGRWRTCCGRS